MERCRYYRVAEHLFSVTADEAWLEMMTNYVPFVVDSADECCFSLQCRREQVPPLEGYSPLFTDTTDADMPRLEVSRTEQGDWMIAMAMFRDSEVVAHLSLTPDFRQATLYCSHLDKWSIDNALMLQFAFATAPQGTLEMHAAVVKRSDKAYVFLGKSGTGKSTHARQWLQAFTDAELLNDDNPVIRVQGGEVRAYGSPWSGKTLCYKNESALVEAIYMLKQAPDNVLTELTLPEAYAAMMMSVSGMKINKGSMDCLYETIVKVIQTVRMYHLDCLPNEDAARVAAKF